MKIPKSLKLPRKLKKEVKKGITRNVLPYRNIGFSSYLGLSQTHITVSYSGSNTKAFRRLCKYARKEEKRVYEQMIKDEINKQFDWLDDVSDIKTFTIEHLKQFQRKMFCEPTIPKAVIRNVPDFWKEPQRYIIGFDPATGDDITTASCIGLYCKDNNIQLRATKAILPITY